MIDFLLENPAEALRTLVLMAPALLLAVTVHEAAHAWTADRLGDPTPRALGRLTLNPLPHVDLLGALAFVLAGFGWARPVPVNPARFRSPRRDMMLVGAAGPAANFLAALASLGVWALMPSLRGHPFLGEPLAGVLRFTYVYNLALGLFNLIPLPPLDGGHVLPYILPRRAIPALRTLDRYGPLLLLALALSGGTRLLLGPPFALLDAALRGLVTLLLAR